MDRSKAFHALEKHAWYRTLYARLSEHDMIIVKNFIMVHKGSDHNKFVTAINRMGLEYIEVKNIGLIQDLLLAAATNLKQGEKNEQSRRFS